MRSVFLAATLFASVVGCSRSPEPAAAGPACSTTSTRTMEALASTPSPLTLDKSQHAVCTQGWTCDDIQFFGSLAACTASCGSGCFRDFNCKPNCLCP